LDTASRTSSASVLPVERDAAARERRQRVLDRVGGVSRGLRELRQRRQLRLRRRERVEIEDRAHRVELPDRGRVLEHRRAMPLRREVPQRALGAVARGLVAPQIERGSPRVPWMTKHPRAPDRLVLLARERRDHRGRERGRPEGHRPERRVFERFVERDLQQRQERLPSGGEREAEREAAVVAGDREAERDEARMERRLRERAVADRRRNRPTLAVRDPRLERVGRERAQRDAVPGHRVVRRSVRERSLRLVLAPRDLHRHRPPRRARLRPRRHRRLVGARRRARVDVPALARDRERRDAFELREQ